MSILSLTEDGSWFRSFGKFLNRAVKFNSPVAVRVGDFILYAKTLDRLFALILIKFKLSEAFEDKLFKSLLKPGMTVVDIGANLGRYTLTAAKAVGMTGQVYAFEPDEENFSLLKRAVEASGYKNVLLYENAVSNDSGRGVLFFCEEHRGNHRIFDDGTDRKRVEIQTVALDYLFPPGKKIDLIKMDIEGAEATAQKGMKRILSENPDIKIMSEFCPYGLLKSGSDPREFLKSWIDLGFGIYLIDESRKKLEKTSVEKLIRQFTGAQYGNIFLSRNQISDR